MPNFICASCKSRVEEGAVRCSSCGTSLSSPGAFIQVVGWVVVSMSLIPFAIAEVTTAERDLVPIILGAVVLVAGGLMVLAGRARNKSMQPTVLPESDPVGASRSG